MTKRRMNYCAVIFGGLLVHLVFLYSIFDIYFTSPLVHGMTSYRPSLQAPAKRLVLFVADGLRADKLFELDKKGRSRAPFIRRIVKDEGSWGVSHTRVPTESRPGHVALIAGFYEDVSAVAKGWKENPVDFDSVFNQSRVTWSWGSPDILPMFAKGATGDHVLTFMYPSESEDFAGADPSKLDTWVFDKVKDFLTEAARNTTLRQQLQQDGVVLFLHLLGLDVNGHSHGPQSSEYARNIDVVDDGVETITMAVEDYFGYDGRTAYLFTSDHGMTDWGSHGAGHADETMTPLVAWGAGVRRPLQEPPAQHTKTPSGWGFDGLRRIDVEQADVAAFMTSLLGLAFPANSVGTVPTEFLDSSLEYKADCALQNALALLAQYKVKMDHKKSTSFRLLFKTFHDNAVLDEIMIKRQHELLVGNEKFDEAITYCRDIIKITMAGLQYYHQYDRFFLGLSIVLGFLGWMAYILTIVLNEQSTFGASSSGLPPVAAIVVNFLTFMVTLLIFLVLTLQSLPIMYYIYCLLPVFLWCLVLHRLPPTLSLWRGMWDGNCWASLAQLILCGLGLEVIVLSFFHRQLLSLGLAVMGLYPLTTHLRSSRTKLVVSWLISCLMVAVFPLLPVIGREKNYNLVMLSICSTFVLYVGSNRAGIINFNAKKRRTKTIGNGLSLQLIQVFIIFLVSIIVHNTSSCLYNKLHISCGWHITSWLILGCGILLPLFSSTHARERLTSIGLSLLAVYFLLSIAHEGFFCLALCFMLHNWIEVESQLGNKNFKELSPNKCVNGHSVLECRRDNLSLSDLRRAYTFIFLIMTSFYGTGNIASINSFEPSSVYCFITVFSPFIMGALLMLKVLIPFLLVACAFHVIIKSLHVQARNLLFLVLLMSDFMGLHFFFLVRDHGSWLEIGTTISHYTIMMTMIMAVTVLMGAARFLTTVKLGEGLFNEIKQH